MNMELPALSRLHHQTFIFLVLYHHLQTSATAWNQSQQRLSRDSSLQPSSAPINFSLPARYWLALTHRVFLQVPALHPPSPPHLSLPCLHPLRWIATRPCQLHPTASRRPRPCTLTGFMPIKVRPSCCLCCGWAALAITALLRQKIPHPEGPRFN